MYTSESVPLPGNDFARSRDIDRLHYWLQLWPPSFPLQSLCQRCVLCQVVNKTHFLLVDAFHVSHHREPCCMTQNNPQCKYSVSISCMPNLADCEHPWESEFSEPQSMPIFASAPVLVILRSIWLLCKERLFEHSHFWIEELEVSEFVCFLLPTLGTLVLLLSSQHIADAFSQECRYS